ncbi:maleylpyruvate isomerase family mycothiol-dependent enzyme [Streptomyces sp. NPDC002722]|uniref:maleylpyruvate isomerase family mycothiol-dependent enzyme n=1 Tax=Streptomyces sp. NPDC002722 TaxID=3154425 RepID=UPI00331E717B
MSRTLTDARGWMQQGTKLLLASVDGLAPASYDAPSGLPGWSRRHLVAHVAANADALCNLVHWAATGEKTPMYASLEERAAGIARGARLPAEELAAWTHESSERLETAMAALPFERWQAEVVTAQGRTVPASEIPWMRSRETCVHAVDLATGVGFADLPKEFLAALVVDIKAQRGLDTVPDGRLPDLAAYLAGRPYTLAEAPELGPWL